MEVALHRPNPVVVRDLDFYLEPAITLKQGPKSTKQVLIVTTCQHSKTELLSWDEDTCNEKDRLLEAFVDYAKQVCDAMRARGYWADYTDPASGLLVMSPGQRVWPEIQSLERLLGYRMGQAAGCHILMHPKWGSRMYPATMFTDAPEDVIKQHLLGE